MLALVTAIAAAGHDEDLAPLLDACASAGLHARAVAWDDPTVSWQQFDAALLRSPWDYTERLPEFLAWCDRRDQQVSLLNPVHVIRWNTDKHYLSDLATFGIPVVTTTFVEPDAEPLQALQAFLGTEPAPEFVVKPTVSAGARDTQRYARAQEFAASNHVARLLDQGRGVMLQPYLPAVDRAGETALIYFEGSFSHAIAKGALLQPDAAALTAPFAAGDISSRSAGADELALGEQVLVAASRLLRLGQPLSYARVDLIRDDGGHPRLLELELIEPSLFFAQAPGSADRFAAALASRLSGDTIRARTGTG
ncbi:RimK family alpha-L-glutamate ligase [Pseudoxanthomonas sp. UTMC 1351]|uniref:RimK family alpha-L-glutamate ligase n=1 Tax=Pseudoxanthomonas sp. UTMC 1351 TaxID=2695853 RepID=UPI0034CD61CC